MQENRRIAFNTILRWTGEVLNKALWFIFLIFLARKLGSEDFGVFSYAFAFGSLLATFTDLGTNIYLTREITRTPEKAGKILQNTIALKIPLSLAVLVIAVAAARINPATASIVVLFTLSLLISAFLDPLNSFYRARKQMIHETIVLFTWRVLMVSLSLAGIFFLRPELDVVAYSFIAAGIASFCLSLLVTRKIYGVRIVETVKSIDFHFWTTILKSSLPLGVLLIFGGIFFKLNVICLQNMRGPQEVGWYSAGFKLIEGTFFVPSIFIGSLFPFLCEHNSGGEVSAQGAALFKKAFLFLTGIAAAIGAGTSFFAEDIIVSLYGDSFLPAVAPFRILVWSLVFIYLNELFFFNFISAGKHRIQIRMFTAAIIIYTLLCFALIPQGGYIGAAWVLLITQILLLAMNSISLRKIS